MITWTVILQGLVTFLIGGGLATTIAVIWKVRPEAGKIIIDAAKGAVIVQAKVIDELREELSGARKEVRSMRTELEEMNKRMLACMKENESLHRQIENLLITQARHEREIKRLTK